MTSTTLLRSAAVATGLVGLMDPSWTARRAAPVRVEVKAPADLQRAAGDVRRNLASQLGNRITFDSDAQPAAVVLVGRTESMRSFDRDGVSISTVSLGSPRPNVRVIATEDPDPVRVGWTATVAAVVEGIGMAGKASRIVLEQRGVEVAHEEHQWKENAERFDARLHYAPPSSGTSTVTLRVLPFEGEAVVTDNAVDLRLMVTERRLKVLVHEPRPSWNAAFVRRSLEQDPSFEVSTVVQATSLSGGLAVRAGSPPAVLTAAALSPFDVVLIGAPEELRQSELEALRAFARIRGGAIVFLPDRRPAGRYLDLIPSARFDEVLVDSPIAIQSIAGAPLRASEIAVYRARLAGVSVLASIELSDNRGKSPVVLEWPIGAGRIVFSGAMDAWRFRAAPDDGFGRFWRSRIAEAASAAPARLEASIVPGVPRSGQDVTIRARIRPTELEHSTGGTRTPAVRARLVGADGRDESIRLWPTAEVGVFEGRFEAPPPGTYDLQVTTATGASADEVVTVVADSPDGANPSESEHALRLIAASTGGVAVEASDLTPLERHLRGLTKGEVERAIRPARSMATLLLFVGLLAAEWTIRRRRGRA
ncbi:MAG: hypothetical protein ABW292_24370 [Vicinamibacterales bacterium]